MWTRNRTGASEITVTQLCQRSKMARNTFYDLFESNDDALIRSNAEGRRVFLEPLQLAAGGGDWLERVDRGLAALLESVAAEPLIAELCLVHSFGAPGEVAGQDYEAAVEALITLLDGGREAGRERLGDAYVEPPPLTEEYLARVALSLISTRVCEGTAAQMAEQHARLIGFIACYFLGPAEGQKPALAGATAK